MKKNFLPLALALACLTWLPANSQQWQPMGHGLLPAGYGLHGISVVSENVAWAVANVDTATFGPVPAGHLIQVLKTTDGGLNWSVFDVEESAGRISWNVEAVDENTAWLTTQDLGSGLGRALYKTEDGGETWTQKLFHRAGGVFVRALDEQHIYCQNGRFTARSEDGGENWSVDTLEAYAPDEFNVLYSGNNMAAAVGDTVWVGTTKGRICRATDFGNTIELIDIDTATEFEIINVAFNDYLHGMLQTLSSDGFARLLITSDGGASWQLAASQPPDDGALYNIAAIPGIEGAFVLVPDPYLTIMSNVVNALYTLDFGKTLKSVLPATGNSNSVDFISLTNGWATAGLIVDKTTPVFFKWEAPAVSPVVLSETFNVLTAPTGWTAEGYWDFGTSTTHSTGFFSPPEHGTFAVLNDDLLGASAISKDKLITPQLDLAFYEDVRLTFESFFPNGDWNGANETAKVFVSKDSLATWQEIFNLETGNSSEWETIRLDLSDFAGQKIHLGFEYDDAFEWNYGWAIDDVEIGVTPAYDAEGHVEKISEYSINTPKHTPALQANFAVENFGSASLADATVQFDALHDGSPFFNTNLPLPEISSFTTHQGSIALPPLTAPGDYNFNLTFSQPDLGGIFYEKAQSLEISDSIMARDDGSRETSIGFPFGNPSWYGYYGSEFKLLQTDTLTGISIWITSQTAGAFNLVVNTKDELGIPKVEIFHSEPIPVPAGCNDWVYVPLPTPLILTPDVYLFAAGQDTVQGIHGFGFDATTFNQTYWIMGLLPTYDWVNITDGGFNFHLMIRPHFNPFTPSAVSSVPAGEVSLSPNPAADFLHLDLPQATAEPLHIRLFDAQGKVASHQLLTAGQPVDLKGLQAGIYLIEVATGERRYAGKFVKQ